MSYISLNLYRSKIRAFKGWKCSHSGEVKQSNKRKHSILIREAKSAEEYVLRPTPPSNLVRTPFCPCSCGSLPPDESIMVSLSWRSKDIKIWSEAYLLVSYLFPPSHGATTIISSLFVLGRKKRAPSVCLLKWGCMMACRDSKSFSGLLNCCDVEKRWNEGSTPHIIPSETKQSYKCHDHPNWWRKYASRNPHGRGIP